VTNPDLFVDQMRDADRVLVTKDDHLLNVEQIRELRAGGYDGFLSFEPFAAEVQELDDPAPAIAASMTLIREDVTVAAL
jgi:2-keto-myo-inositol isomerase